MLAAMRFDRIGETLLEVAKKWKDLEVVKLIMQKWARSKFEKQEHRLFKSVGMNDEIYHPSPS